MKGFALKLQRPLAFLDIEATGISPRTDRIIDLAIVKIMPDGQRLPYDYRVHPERPIPPESTAIHGIVDADVADKPPFSHIARNVYDILDDSDLAGFNIIRFDIPMLVEEFLRAGLTFDVDRRRLIDAQRIFHRKEPRNLTAALAFYCNEMHLGAHGAMPDVEATIRVFESQIQRYADLPNDLDTLDAFCNPRDPDWVDRTGRLKWSNGQVVLNFGRKKGVPLKQIADEDPSFIKWMLRSDFPADMRKIVDDILANRPPAPPPPKPAPSARDNDPDAQD